MCEISIIDPPEVSVPQKIYVVNENSELQVECQVDANPSAFALWKPISKKFIYIYQGIYLYLSRNLF